LDGDGGKPLRLSANQLTPADTNSKLRRVIKTTLDLFALSHPNPKIRRDVATKLGQEQKAEYVEIFEAQLKTEPHPEVRLALSEAKDLTLLASEDETVRVGAIERLGAVCSVNSLSFLQTLAGETKQHADKYGLKTTEALRVALHRINEHVAWANFLGTGFRGLSLAAVLLVAALGLAITFGLMGVINMAHGEIMMVGAYTTYVTQTIFVRYFGAAGTGFDCYFVVALVASFLTAAAVGLVLERGIIRFLYKRPLESLLATWGVSLVLQQMFRHIFGAANVQVGSPRWLSGSFVVNDILLAYNRLFVIGFAVLIVFAIYLLLTRTSLGLQIRAVMQNRAMASCVGVRTDRVNMMTFALGSGLAGMAGACLSQIGNVGPGLGQNYIVDCFMVVVLGGVGNLIGTVSAALGIGVTDQVLQPWLGAVMGKITVLSGIILFLQWRPAGLFATRGRSLEG
jgi:urea transport system permease protein